MGAVYLAEHVKMGRKSAIKVMSASMSHDPDAVSRFNREANNASRIQHPNICAIYDFGETPDGLIYLAMEFIEGDSLNGILTKSGPMSLQRAGAILSQTASALKMAHDAGIVHRDLKPDNIMIAQQGGKDLVKVVDFGIAKAVGGDESGQKVTKTGLVVGTPEYMSPEQLSGDKLDGRSDLYSLALVYYRMITGTLPFQAETSQETMIKRLTDDPMPLRQALPTGNFPPGLQAVMDRALARYAGDRYPDAVEFADDVANAIKGIAPEGGATMIVGAGDMKTMVAGPPPKTRVASAAEGRGSPPAEPAKKKSPVMAIAAGVVILAAAGGGYAMFGRGSTATPPDTTHQSTQASTPVEDSTPPAVTPPSTPAQQQNPAPLSRPATTNPPATQTNTRPNPPAGATHDQTAIQAELDAAVDIIAGDNPSARRAKIRRLIEIFGYSDLPADMRADAARQIASGYSSVADEAKAAEDVSAERAATQSVIEYYQKADQLAPSDRVKGAIRMAQTRLQNIGNP